MCSAFDQEAKRRERKHIQHRHGEERKRPCHFVRVVLSFRHRVILEQFQTMYSRMVKLDHHLLSRGIDSMAGEP